MNKLKENSKIHFIGIGGVSMSGLAQILSKNGHSVKGSDRDITDTTKHLESLGIKCYKGHESSNIDGDEDLIVYTAAIKDDNEEIQAAKRHNITLIDRATLLGIIMTWYNFPISIAGTHGKTSTTSMLTQLFLHNNLDPTVSVGGFLPSINGNFKMGNSPYFLVESCEYCNSFLKFFPKIAIVLNIEADHLDFFKDEEDVRNSFKKFIENVDNDGYIIINSEIKDIDNLLNTAKGTVIKYSTNNFSNSDIYCKNIAYDNRGCPTYDLFYKNELLGNVKMQTFGEHNISNSLVVCGVGKILNLTNDEIIKSIEEYKGVDRRFQHKGVKNQVTVIDDYAHHPTEIKATLLAAKKIKSNKLYCVFQPHTYTRTISLLDDFASSFDNADVVIVMDIYSAREKDEGIVHSKDLVNAIVSNGKECHYLPTFEFVEKYLKMNCIDNDMLITMGAGDVYLVGENYLNA